MKARTPGRVSVILVNFRGVDDTITSVRGLLEVDWPTADLEIIVVENGSGDDSAARLKAELGDTIRLVVSKQNLGFAGGSNLGVRHSTGEFVGFLNNDARPDAGWVRYAVETFQHGSDIGAVASKVLDWDGQRADYVDAAITWYGMGYKPHTGEKDAGRWDVERDVLFGTGAAMFVRASVFEELGGFDEDFFMFYEDVDLGWRLNLHGHRVRFQPRSLAYHKHHASMKEFGDYREQYLLERNALATLYKNLDDTSLAQVLPGALLLAVRRGVARAGLDSTELDIRRADGDADRQASVDKSLLAGVYAIDQIVEHLPEIAARRASIQSSRVRTDRQLRALFGETDEPAFPIDSYLDGYDKIVGVLGSGPAGQRRRRVVVITGDPIGQRMAGPAIRAWNIARLLAREHDVRLLSLTRAVASGESFEVGVLSPSRPDAAAVHEEWADILVVQGHALELFPAIETTSKLLVVDIYDPMHLEQLEQGRKHSISVWNDQISDSTVALNRQLAVGDFFLCASERQRHFWLGQLAALGRINAFTYSRDPELASLLAVVPFGMPSDDPKATAPAIRGVVPGIGADDKVVIWGGGIYDWFDPETLIRAIAVLAERRPDVKLFFMGIKHPNPDVPEMEIVARTRALADRLGLTGGHVFFNEAWVPYEQRQNYLLEADLGVSTHFQHVETTFSFRTRILDYLWAGLPIVSTAGDSFADLIQREDLGAVVAERDVEGLARAIESLLYDDKRAAVARKNVKRARQLFTWERVLAPLLQYVREPHSAADKAARGPQRAPRRKRNAPPNGTVVIPNRPTRRRRGLGHDAYRVVYYLQNGGPSAVIERFRARRARKRAAASDD